MLNCRVVVGKQLIHLAQRMSDDGGSAVDASPLFNIAATLLHHNKAHSKASFFRNSRQMSLTNFKGLITLP